MLRRAGLSSLLAALVALAVVAPAQARPRGPFYWDVSLRGSQSATWSFAIEDPPACPGFAGRSGQGRGKVTMSFASPAKRPFRLAFDPPGSHHTVFHGAVPLSYASQGAISSANGTACGAGAEEPAPIPRINDSSGCGAQTGRLEVTAWLDRRKLRLDGLATGLRFVACPTPWDSLQWGVYAQGVWSQESTCKPDEYALDSLVVPATSVSLARFTARKPFVLDVNQAYHCEFPPRFVGDKGALEINTVIRYRLTLQPRARPRARNSGA
ncbi:hypothetical protein [Patulibacter defluvii]|uniref:hypothetical protein n=1 Tax=Patulibacter defluvii TaxID=3095358 RepID=UPI002A74F594|nr:hypothetical protein [Patulibacter sp. DM4]